MYCGNCGTATGPGTTLCLDCGFDSQRAPASAPTVAAAADAAFVPDPTIRSVRIGATSFRLGLGESLWRSYRVTQLKTSRQGEGMLIVTNARVVFSAAVPARGTRRGSIVVQETRVESITGLTAYESHQLSLRLILGTVIAGLLTLYAIAEQSLFATLFFLMITGACAAALYMGRGLGGMTGVLLHSSASQATPVSLGQFGQATGNHLGGSWWTSPLRGLGASIGGHDALDLLIGFPGEDASRMVAELGALLYDLQTRGDLARSAWGMPNSGDYQR